MDSYLASGASECKRMRNKIWTELIVMYATMLKLLSMVNGAAGQCEGGGGVRVAGHKEQVVHDFRLYGHFYTSFWL